MSKINRTEISQRIANRDAERGGDSIQVEEMNILARSPLVQLGHNDYVSHTITPDDIILVPRPAAAENPEVLHDAISAEPFAGRIALGKELEVPPSLDSHSVHLLPLVPGADKAGNLLREQDWTLRNGEYVLIAISEATALEPEGIGITNVSSYHEYFNSGAIFDPRQATEGLEGL